MEGSVDIKMGTLSKTIPSVGGYVAGKKEIITYLRHASRAYIFSAASAACAGRCRKRGLQSHPGRARGGSRNLTAIRRNSSAGLKGMGFDTLLTTTAIVPVLCGSDESALCHDPRGSD